MGNEHSKSSGGGHVLGGGASSSNPRTSTSNKGSNSSLDIPQNRRSSLPPSTKPKIFSKPAAIPANGEGDREARLAAIEARMGAAEKRGVQKGGGKLAKKLEETKSGAQGPSAEDNRNEVAEMWKSG